MENFAGMKFHPPLKIIFNNFNVYNYMVIFCPGYPE